MEPEQRAFSLSLLLTLVAGFSDTVTFVAADQLFSAHVTGNFIVFAYHAVLDAGTADWSKLLSFPVFVGAVVSGSLLTKKYASNYALLLAEGALLVVSGLLALMLSATAAPWLGQLTAMTIVFAMGLQNAFGRLYPKETYGPTTVMTGTVTQTALDGAELALGGAGATGKGPAIKKNLVIIAGFLVGCLTGALAAKACGLWPVLLPGVALLGFASWQGRYSSTRPLDRPARLR
jgi:uncharacterized membrane protein YoaK (UPF0700 family)